MSGIHGQLCSGEQRQAVCDHLEPSVVHQVRSVHIEVPNKLVATLPPASRQIFATALSRRNPVSPTLQLDCKLHGGGQGSQEDGHGRSVESKEGEDGDGGAE